MLLKVQSIELDRIDLSIVTDTRSRMSLNIGTDTDLNIGSVQL